LNRIISALESAYQAKEQSITAAALRGIEKSVLMQVLDNAWKEHLAAMDYLRQGIHFRGYAQKDPKQEYKRESFEMFTNLLDDIKYEVIRILSKMNLTQQLNLADTGDEDGGLQFSPRDESALPNEIRFDHAEALAFYLKSAAGGV
jgi:preprotein translocase subunit SecA